MTLLLALLLAPFIFLTSCFAAELIAGLKPLRRQNGRPCTATAVIIVPAHNEETMLAAMLDKLKHAAGNTARIQVVADNCTDGTAKIATNMGVEVIERNDQARRGKGYALAFAREHLRTNPPEVVLIIDADCTIDARSIAALIEQCMASGSPCQATNLQKPGADASPAVQLSTFAFFIKNVIRQRALQRLAGRAHLLGTGMAFPWAIFDKAELATGNVVEDLKLGQELAEAGHASVFVEEATVWSNAESEEGTLSQRRRWEGGFLQNAIRAGPSMFARSLMRADAQSLWAAINTMIPPLALLVLLDGAALIVAAVLQRLTGAAAWPPLLLAGALLLSTLALAMAWAAGGSRFVSARGLARIPFYLAWKLPLYVGFIRGGAPKEWQRTRRD